MKPAVLVLSTPNLHFPLDTEAVLRKAGHPTHRLADLNEFISSPLRAQPFLAVLEVGTTADIDRALLAYEWAETMQPLAPGRFLLLLGSKHIQLGDRAGRFRGVEIAQLPLPPKNLVFKIELQLRLLASEPRRAPPPKDGFLVEFTGPERERVMVLRGPGSREGSWKPAQVGESGKARWRWVKGVESLAATGKEIAWTVEGKNAPVFDEARGEWRVNDEAADLLCHQGKEELFSARKVETRREGAAEELRLKERAGLGEQQSSAVQTAGEGKGFSRFGSGSEKRESEAAGIGSGPGEKRGAATIGADQAGTAAKESVAAEGRPSSGGEFGEPSGGSPEKTAALSSPASALPGEVREKRETVLGSSLPLTGRAGKEFSREAEVRPDEPKSTLGPRPTEPAYDDRGEEPNEAVGGPGSLRARRKTEVRETEEESPVSTPAPGPELRRRAGDAPLSAEEEGREGPAPGTYSTDEDLKRASREERERKTREKEKDRKAEAGREAPEPKEKAAGPASGAGAERRAVPIRGEEERAGKERTAPTAAPAAEAEKPREPSSSSIEGKSSSRDEASFSPEAESDWQKILLPSDAAPDGGDSSVPGRAGREGTEARVLGGGRSAEDADHYLKMRLSLTMTLEELGDDNSSWHPVSGYRIYLSAKHRYYGVKNSEDVFPLWVYEGELAPEFLEQNKSWKFYDRLPLSYAGWPGLPEPVEKFLREMTAGGGMTPAAEPGSGAEEGDDAPVVGEAGVGEELGEAARGNLGKIREPDFASAGTKKQSRGFLHFLKRLLGIK